MILRWHTLEPDYLPERLPHRWEVDDIRLVLQLMRQHGMRADIVVRGGKGTGKTQAVQLALRAEPVEHFWVKSRATARATMEELCRLLRVEFRSGARVEKLWQAVRDRIPERACIIIDGADRFLIRGYDSEKYALLRCLTSREDLSLVLITRGNLSHVLRRAEERGCYLRELPERIELRGYTPEEIKDILVWRAELALEDGEAAISGVAELMAERIFARGGDMSYGIALLRESLAQALAEGRTEINEKHVERAEKRLARRELEILEELTPTHRLLLHAAFSSKTTGEAYRKYSTLAERAGITAREEKWLRQAFSDLEAMNLVELRRKVPNARRRTIAIPLWVPESIKSHLAREFAEF